MWLVEEMGAQKFRETVSSYIGHELKPGKHIKVRVLLLKKKSKVYAGRRGLWKALFRPMAAQPLKGANGG